MCNISVVTSDTGPRAGDEAQQFHDSAIDSLHPRIQYQHQHHDYQEDSHDISSSSSSNVLPSSPPYSTSPRTSHTIEDDVATAATTSSRESSTFGTTTTLRISSGSRDNVVEQLESKPAPLAEPVLLQEEKLHFKEHFSSLLFGGSVSNTVLEFALLSLPFVPIAFYGQDSNLLNVKGSMPMIEVAVFLVICSMIRRIYNAYLEAIYFSFPSLRTQPPKDHRLQKKKDIMGRDQTQLEILDSHDKWTLVSQFVLNFGLYYALPGFYPAHDSSSSEDVPTQSFRERFCRLILNHYVLSFGMYWAHRSLHVIPWLWNNIHSLHHYAKHPLSRNTYEDHWIDNLLNAILGHVYAQILVPLDPPTFWFSRIFRILESLEKHSGVSCGFNLAHSAQQWMPFAQMPHHHDWHHEGFKGSNYTFSSLGGLWDCVFGTRKGGRFKANHGCAATREDLKAAGAVGGISTSKGIPLPHWFSPLWPLVGLTLLVGLKLKNGESLFHSSSCS